MTDALLSVLVALFLWWFGTGALFWVAQRAITRGGRGIAMAGASVLLAVAVWGLWTLGAGTTHEAAYLSFACGLAVWAWVELGLLLGYVTGPEKRPCPPGLAGPERFFRALGVVLWHEIALLALGVLLVWLTWGAANQIGAWTFVLLAAMRISAKLNLFLGVPYPPGLPLPGHLVHMATYFRRSSPTALMPAAITVATAVATLVAWRAANPALDPFHVTAYMLFWTMLVLGIVEHWFLILPVEESVIWQWFIRARNSTKPAPVCSRSNRDPAHRDSFPKPQDGDREDGLTVATPLQPTAQGGLR